MKLARGIEAGLDRFCYNLVFKYGRIIRTVQFNTIREPGREIGAVIRIDLGKHQINHKNAELKITRNWG